MTFTLRELLNYALAEDAPNGDITTQRIVTVSSPIKAELMSKAEGVFFGQAVGETIFELLRPKAAIRFHKKDGDVVLPGDCIATIEGPDSTILLAERVMLNFMQRLSGVATITKAFVTALSDSNIAILDTRKTTPLLREWEKKAVLAGGGKNHRHSLSDMVLIKENHLESLATQKKLSELGQVLAHFKSNNPAIPIEIEVETEAQIRAFDFSSVDFVMLDNFKRETIPAAVTLLRGRGFKGEIEVSGNMSLDTIAHYRGLPIQRISVGSLTHSVKALDLSLLLKGPL